MTAAFPASHPDPAQAILRAVADSSFGRVEWERRAGRSARPMLVFVVESQRYRVRHVDVTGAGDWVRIPDEPTAKLVLDSIRADVRSGTPKLAALARYLRGRAPDLLFRRCWERFCDAKSRQGRTGGRQLSRQRIAEFEGHLRRGHLEPLLELPAHRIGYATLEEWRDWLFERELSAGTIRHLVRDVGTCLHWLARRQEIPRVPALPSVHVPDYAPRIPRAADVRTLLDVIPWRLRGQWLARSQLGLRPSEAQRANVADWGFEPETFELPDGAQLVAHVLTVRGKGDRVRYLPVPATWELAAWVGEHRDRRDALRGDGAALFDNPHADLSENPAARWTKASSRRVWLKAARDAKLLAPGRETPLYLENQAMRHAFATHHAALGKELARISEFLGHTDMRTTRRYMKLGAGALVDVVRPK